MPLLYFHRFFYFFFFFNDTATTEIYTLSLHDALPIQGLRYHAFDYISKPFDCDQVRAVVQAALARRLASKRLRSAPEQILATLSHEFRTPLNVIMGYSTMLRDEGETALSDEQRLALDRIQSNSTALLAYVETLFYMVELDRGLVPVHVGPVRVSELLARVAED